jgi:hypothetical protein
VGGCRLQELVRGLTRQPSGLHRRLAMCAVLNLPAVSDPSRASMKARTLILLASTKVSAAIVLSHRADTSSMAVRNGMAPTTVRRRRG